ncbi:MAG: DUF4910 domain-containing protein [Pseudomonadota bacterium]
MNNGDGEIASRLEKFTNELFPICRSITGQGVRETLRRIGAEVPLRTLSYTSGTPVFDWEVPPEWTINDAFLEDPNGQRVADLRTNNLHVLNYSVGVDKKLSLEELKPHLHTLPEQPELIPYRTAYYQRNWGFCLPHAVYQRLSSGTYHAYIDAEVKPGVLEIGECFLPGETEDEVLFYAHTCHPSLANDNLSGIAVSTWLAKWLCNKEKRRFSYRFLWGPGTIGSLTWLAHHQHSVANIKHGLVLVLLGRPGTFHYKQTPFADAPIDRIAARCLRKRGDEHEIRPFDPYGYEERQLCSPGFRLNVGRLSRVPHDEYPEYHTSGDNLDLIDGRTMAEALVLCQQIVDEFETRECFINIEPFGEPKLGKRGLYNSIGGRAPAERVEIMLWILNLCDGNHDLMDIAERSGYTLETIRELATELTERSLLKPI